MPWIAALAAAWLLMFFIGSIVCRWLVADVAPLTTIAWAVVVLGGALLASASTLALAAWRWSRASTATAPADRDRRRGTIRMGRGYTMLAGGCGLAAVLLLLVFRLVHTN